jgi:succinate dehydrogenase/fumarate reductase flavoprotein subunit
MFAVISGAWAGPSAACYAVGKDFGKDINTSEIRSAKEEIFRPVKRTKGVVPGDVIDSLQEITAPIKYNLRRNKERLVKALDVIEKLKEKLSDLQAKDLHYLSKCHEVKSMVLCAELTYRAALMREESRGSHFREDYPQRDDKKWLKWVIIKQQDGEMKLTTQPVPVDRYKIKPFKIM